MNKRTITALAALATATLCLAQKTMYIPQEWRNRTDTLIWAEEDPENKYTWSLSRSRETDNVIILWDKGYGSTIPTNAPSTYSVDIDDLAEKCEEFFALECSQLGFVDPETSNLSRYKVLVLLNHTTDWVCYGGGYDYQVSALWLSPSTCKPVGSAVAHEVGHSFHYMCYCEDSNYGTISGVETGFHSAVGSGSTIWETTANWQALQSYPGEMFTESGFGDIYPFSHNYALTHEWHRYQAYMFLYFLCEYYGDIRTVADVWNYHETSVKDFNQVLMDCKELTVEELYKLHFEYALRAVTWDLDVWTPYRKTSYVGNYKYYCVRDGERRYQVAYASAPQSTGFNVIPLQVPEAGTEVSTEFTALASGTALLYGDPGYYLDGDSRLSKSGKDNYNGTTAVRNFRLGYVALMGDGTRQYFAEDSLYCHGKAKSTATVSMTVPEGVSRLWLVVCPSPATYVQHKWDEDITNDDQWPYHITLTGTDLTSDATVYDSYLFDDRAVGDITVSYNLYMKPDTEEYTISLDSDKDVLITFGTAFQMTADEVASHIQEYGDEGPDVGKMMLYPYDETGALIDAPSGVEGGYGYWYNSVGDLVSADSDEAALCVELDPKSMSFRVSQKPGAMEVGDTPVARLALRYRRTETEEAVARFQIQVRIHASLNGITQPTVEYDADKALPVPAIRHNNQNASSDMYYDLGGRATTKPTRPGIYIKNGRKVVVSTTY